MNLDDLVVAAPALAKGALALGASVPFTAIAKRMLGPAADELAEMMRDQIRLHRYGRQLACVQKAARMAEEAGFTPNEVPSKLLFPLLEGASFEENEGLHTMWAALLANASSPVRNSVRPGYIALLRQMASDEAALLNWLYMDALRQIQEKENELVSLASYWSVNRPPSLTGAPKPVLKPVFNPNLLLTITWYVGELGSPYENLVDAYSKAENSFHTCLEALEGSFLVENFQVAIDDTPVPKIRLTGRGMHLVESCIPPKPSGVYGRNL